MPLCRRRARRRAARCGRRRTCGARACARAARVAQRADAQGRDGGRCARRRIADRPPAAPGQLRAASSRDNRSGRQDRQAGVQQGARDRRRSADPARARLAAVRRRGHRGTRHADGRNGHDPEPLCRYLLREQGRTEADDRRALEPRVALGRQGLAELLAAVGDGIYVTSWLGGNTDKTTGDFSLGLRGHVIENGRSVRRSAR